MASFYSFCLDTVRGYALLFEHFGDWLGGRTQQINFNVDNNFHNVMKYTRNQHNHALAVFDLCLCCKQNNMNNARLLCMIELSAITRNQAESRDITRNHAITTHNHAESRGLLLSPNCYCCCSVVLNTVVFVAFLYFCSSCFI